MPLFEYGCESCGEVFEILLKESKDSVSCPECSGVSHKKVSGCSAVFKGSGTGKTDNISWDMYIGRDADKRREHYVDRLTKKKEIQKKNPNDYVVYNDHSNSYDVVPRNQGSDSIQKENDSIKASITKSAKSK